MPSDPLLAFVREQIVLATLPFIHGGFDQPADYGIRDIIGTLVNLPAHFDLECTVGSGVNVHRLVHGHHRLTDELLQNVLDLIHKGAGLGDRLRRFASPSLINSVDEVELAQAVGGAGELGEQAAPVAARDLVERANHLLHLLEVSQRAPDELGLRRRVVDKRRGSSII